MRWKSEEEEVAAAAQDQQRREQWRRKELDRIDPWERIAVSEQRLELETVEVSAG
jgi:hypothetical protein